MASKLKLKPLGGRVIVEPGCLLKDVDGVFERDPGRSGPPPRRYRAIAWEEVTRVAPGLVQAKADHVARCRVVRHG